MSKTDTVRKVGRDAAMEAEKTLNKANKAAAEAVGERVDSAASATQGHATDFIESLRHAVSAASEKLRGDGYSTVANLVDKAAGQAGVAESRVEELNTVKISNSVQQFIREKPLIAFGGLALAGFLAAAAMQKAHHDIDET